MSVKRVKVNFEELPFQLGVKDRVFSAGSCFAAESARYLESRGMPVLFNPFGTLYNLHSIYMLLERVFQGYRYSEDDLFCEEGLYFSAEHAVHFDSREAGEALALINGVIERIAPAIKESTLFILTPGTSVVYLYNDRVVANCHKLPHRCFTRRLLTVAESEHYLEKITSLVKRHCPRASVLFTLSPVRHSPDNLVENSYSKSILRTALGRASAYGASYLPTYEVVLDELRDYRHYKRDGLHLRREAVDYIMERFAELAFDYGLRAHMRAVTKLKGLASHRAKDPASEATFRLLERIGREVLILEGVRASSILSEIKLAAAVRLVKHFYRRPGTTELLERLLAGSPAESRFFRLILELKRGKGSGLDELKGLNLKSKRLERFRRQAIYDFLVGSG